jgi:branched-subunit amino acid aminotransferase/4-amino-4-deoxychorismate lyase
MNEIQEHLCLNGRLCRRDRARISPLGDGFMFGRGLFETVRVLGGRPLFLGDHLGRLARSAGPLGLAADPGRIATRCARVIAANRLLEGNLKIVLFQDTRETGELIIARKGRYPKAIYARGFRLMTLADDRLAGSVGEFKTLNYLANSLARRRARAAGFDEALFIGARGRVLEGSGCSLFAVEAGRVVTPPLGGGILPGVARARVLRLLGAGRARAGALTLDRLLGADEVFVTNALLGVMPVSGVDRRRYDLGRNPVTRSLQAAYRAAESAESCQASTRRARNSRAGT